MRKLEFFCDRCGIQIPPDCASIYKISNRADRARVMIDLCIGCEAALHRWLDCESEMITPCDSFDIDPKYEN